MRKLLHVTFLPLLFLCGLISCAEPATEVETVRAGMVADEPGTETAATTVYVVRHAEKDLANPSDQNPDLNDEGRARAEALRVLLQDVELGALYATKYTRTKNTLKPLAEERQLEIATYSANDFIGLKERLLQEHAGQKVVVAGHSNTVLPLVQAFGAKTSLSHIPESEYGYIFKVTMFPDKAATVEIDKYNN